jgi:hypothetical protein
MKVFAAKLGLALFFDATGNALPVTGRIVPFWFSNVQSLQGKIPSEFLKALPEPKTLAQGKKSVLSVSVFPNRVPGEGLGRFFRHISLFLRRWLPRKYGPFEIYPQ